MRLVAFSIVILAGAMMASVGAYVDAIPDAKRYTKVDEWGLAVVALGALLMLVEVANSSWRRDRQEKYISASRVAA